MTDSPGGSQASTPTKQGVADMPGTNSPLSRHFTCQADGRQPRRKDLFPDGNPALLVAGDGEDLQHFGADLVRPEGGHPADRP